MLVKVSTLELLYLSLLITAVVSDQINNKYAEKITRSGEKNKTLCEMTSTHPKQFIVKNVCMTEDYSIFDELSQSSRPRLDLVFIDKKVVNVDEKKKEITLDIFALMVWKDERIKAFGLPNSGFIHLPPLTLNSFASIWSPFPKLVILNKRNQKYLRDPVVAEFALQSIEAINNLVENISISTDFPIVQSGIEWSITISCHFDFSTFPFDKNTCPFVFRFTEMDVSLGFLKNSLEELVRVNDRDGFLVELKQTTSRNQYSDEWYFTDVMLSITIKRQAPKYIYQYYIPCITIVIASSFSFIIPLSAIPGRVALLVTQFLTLTNIFINQMVRIHV